MTAKRFVGTTVAAFVVSQILAIVVHGIILAPDYAPFYGTLLRRMPDQAEPRMLLLPLAHLCFVLALVWVYGRVRLAGGAFARGMKLGFLAWVIGQLPLWLLWYAEQPWPDTLVVKQLALELVSSLIIGLTIAMVGGPVSSALVVAPPRPTDTPAARTGSGS